MSSTTVFIDDAVQGHLPAVCAKSGEPAEKVMRIEQDLSGGLGAIWILLFFGPLGWALLLVLGLARRRRMLTVRLPYGDRILREYATRGRLTFQLAAAFAVVLGAMFVLEYAFHPVTSSTALAVGVITLVVGVISVSISSWYTRRLVVPLALDASGRWVTLNRVHPDFASACDAARRAARQSTAPLDR